MRLDKELQNCLFQWIVINLLINQVVHLTVLSVFSGSPIHVVDSEDIYEFCMDKQQTYYYYRLHLAVAGSIFMMI